VSRSDEELRILFDNSIARLQHKIRPSKAATTGINSNSLLFKRAPETALDLFTDMPMPSHLIGWMLVALLDSLIHSLSTLGDY
jgi:hypothetical protein